ncbi:MAG: hypothetical protein OSB43_16870 [Nocardioides sp.]|uniref:hypothetical protein n=1 Tax=Nocardioides sp. TaxID=35761 RepID=UPI000C8D7EB7|nr:hypothetical protein [Nocardioides sp.]MAS54645.1 hypothetical protein [Pimelobacter sp.]MDE0777951.1 hypothetical protein [Nocardioides sp.]
MLRTRAVAAGILLTLAVLTGGCASGTDSSSSEGVVTVDIAISDDQVTPNGEELSVGVGQEVDLVVTAEAPGEIHVHSEPEQEFAYEGTGEPETFSLSIDRPGQVEVESHSLDRLIVKLVVS